MIRGLRLRSVFVLAAISAAVGAFSLLAGSLGNAMPQSGSALPSAAAIVKPQAYVSLDPVPRGKTFEAAVVVDIARGFHMNSHKPSDEYLIPTTITPQPPCRNQACGHHLSRRPAREIRVFPDETAGCVYRKRDVEAEAGGASRPRRWAPPRFPSFFDIRRATTLLACRR